MMRRELSYGAPAGNTFDVIRGEWNDDGALTTTNLADIEDSSIALNANI
ncbi:TPA_asm: hypothetical protein PROPHIFSQJ01-1_56 [Mycobacterium phage prophiFSQJ01-1]|nr:Uncharacterised protein [Mycobacteroides abscessus subsp. abscessus]SIK13938.1 Uncharacterised protein [Mycobacteroides abscessus subsp. abscessus]SIN25535.1 Uncharacterised protein [Mycobacteroides abscessus subsp. abscessus]SLI51378.1 Uncharacterised protein [Mycobacteroides abscessus subsp. abscessus]DAZ90342.1 TPA_asm: hypothetical protein PROPHIFSQJ01-1_56 [Mycobacterium phage prophiFSQJ01-1]